MVTQQIAHMKAREQRLSRERLFEMLSYNPETGQFTWRRRSNSKVPAGARAGQKRNDGHRAINIDGVRYYEHRLVWLYVHGRWPAQHIDHANMDGTDNRLCNLREAQGSDNYGNRGLRADNTSGIKGVIYYNGRWYARISRKGRSEHLGSFATSQEAADAYRLAAKEHFRNFARTISPT